MVSTKVHFYFKGNQKSNDFGAAPVTVPVDDLVSSASEGGRCIGETLNFVRKDLKRCLLLMFLKLAGF